MLHEALLATHASPGYFLSRPDCSGSLDDYWRVLQKDGNLTAEKMAKFQNPITSTPMHLPQLINGESLLHLFHASRFLLRFLYVPGLHHGRAYAPNVILEALDSFVSL